MFVDTFIRRPILAAVCSLVIVLAGALAIPNMPIAWYPDVTPPTVSVTAVYTGANAETVEAAVTTPLEQAINGVEGMIYMSSSSTNSGVSTINVYFDINRDADLAAVDVQNRVNQTLGRLPADVRTSGVTVTKNTAGFMGALARIATRGRNANVLQHAAGHLKARLDAAARGELAALIHDYRRGLVPLVVPVTLLHHHARAHAVAYLQGQTFLEPHPRELMLRNHI